MTRSARWRVTSNAVARADAGWTLLEVIAVLVIIGVAVVSVAPRMQSAIESFFARQVARDVSDAFYDLRAVAAVSGRVVELHGGPEDIRVTVDGREIPDLMPDWVTSVDGGRLAVKDRLAGDAGWSITFHPDGRVSPAEIVVVMRDRPRFFVRVAEDGIVQLVKEAGR